MALVRDPIARARSTKTPLQAARLHDELEAELAMNPDVDGTDWERDAEEALQLLNSRHPDLADVDRDGQTPTGWAPRLSSRAQDWVRDGDHPRPVRKRPASPGRRKSSSATRRGSSGRSAVAGAADNLGVTAATSTATDVALGAIRVGLGLALCYLLLTPRGSRALSTILSSVSGAFHTFVAPLDPLANLGQPAAGSAPSTTTAPKNLATGPRGQNYRKGP